jgi:hypothetical protein
MRLHNDFPSRTARLTFALTLAYAWCAGPRLQQARAADPPPREVRKADPAKIQETTLRNFDMLAAASTRIPRETFDPAAVVEQVGRDPARLTEWVRTKTYWVPYRGTLRGARGVLMDRMGSHQDRALLLAELLSAAGHKARLVHVRLGGREAADVLDRLPPVPPDAVPRSAWADSSSRLLEEVAAAAGADPARLRKTFERVSLRAGRTAEEVVQRVSEQAPMVADAIGAARAADEPARKAEAIGAMGDYWWVQRQEGGEWVDLPPLVSLEGRARPAPAEAVEADAQGRFALPAAAYHEVDVRVVIERWNAGRLEEEQVLTHTLRPADLVGQRIVLLYVPADWPKDLDLTKDGHPGRRMKAVAAEQRRWIPTLMVGGQVISSNAAFTAEGQVVPNAAAEMAEAWGFSNAAGRVEGILGSGRVGGEGGATRRDDATATAKTRLTAAWVEYDVRSPAPPARRTRRDVFDLIGPAARTSPPAELSRLTDEQRVELGLTLLGETEILPLGCQPSPEFVCDLVAGNVLSNRQAMLDALAMKGPLDQAKATQLVKAIKPPVTPLYQLALARAEWSSQRGKLYIDRPNILTHYLRPRAGAEDGVVVCRGFDIVSNEMAVHLGAAGAAIDPVRARIEQGVLDTNVEAMILAGGCAQVENTAEVFRSAGDWVTVAAGNRAALAGTRLPPDARARMERDLAAGYTLLVPREPIRREGGVAAVAWWRVDPTTGHTLGISEDGRGGASTELTLTNILIVVLVASTIRCMWIYMGVFGGPDVQSTPEWRQGMDHYRAQGYPEPPDLQREIDQMQHDAWHFTICLGTGAVAIATMPETGGWQLASLIFVLLSDYGH